VKLADWCPESDTTAATFCLTDVLALLAFSEKTLKQLDTNLLSVLLYLQLKSKTENDCQLGSNLSSNFN